MAVMRPLVGRAFGAIDIPVLPEQLGAMAAARAGRAAARNPFERGNRLGQMILFERRLFRHPVLPHVIGNLVAALDHRCCVVLSVSAALASSSLALGVLLPQPRWRRAAGCYRQGARRAKTPKIGCSADQVYSLGCQCAENRRPSCSCCKVRRKDGKQHRYWSVVENTRTARGRVVQRHVLYLGEINDTQELAWRRSIEIGAARAGAAVVAGRGAAFWRFRACK